MLLARDSTHEPCDPADALRRRLAIEGAHRLADSELLAILVGGDVSDGARLLVRAGGLEQLQRAGVLELLEHTPEAHRIHAALELGRRAVDLPIERGEPILSAADVYALLRGRLVTQEREELHVLGLDTHNRVVRHFVAGLGTVHQVQVDPRDIFRPLVRDAVHAAIVVHNHPSGEPTPSDADAELTARLIAAGEVVGVRLLDHVVVARSGYFAFSSNEALVTATRQ